MNNTKIIIIIIIDIICHCIINTLALAVPLVLGDAPAHVHSHKENKTPEFWGFFYMNNLSTANTVSSHQYFTKS